MLPAIFLPSTCTDRNRPCFRYTNKHSQFGRDPAGFPAEVRKGHNFATRRSMNSSEGSTLVCRECTVPRSDRNSQEVCALKDNVRICPVWEATTTYLAGLHSIEVFIPSKHNLQSCSLMLISGGLNTCASLEYFVAASLPPFVKKKKHLTARGNLARFHTWHNHRVIKEESHC